MSRVEFKLKQNDGEYLKSWRVTDFANKISEIHYKQEVLNEINNKIQQGANPKNFFVFDKSFSIHKSNRYVGIHKLDTKTGVKNLYHLGAPIALYSNHKLDSVYHVFNSFSSMFTEFNKDEVKEKAKLDKNLLYIFIKEAIQSDETIHIIKYKKYLNKRIEMISDTEIKEKLNKLVLEEFKKLTNRYKNSYQTQKELIEFDEKLQNLKLSKTEQKKYVELTKKVSGKFEYYFIANKRPIVGFYNEENNNVEILCANFIKQSGKDEKQFNLKEISHNSPYTIIFVATYVLTQLFYQMYANKLDRLYNFNGDDDTELENEGYEEREELANEEVQEELALFEEIINRLGNILDEEEQEEDQEEDQHQLEQAYLPPGVTVSLQNIHNSNVEKMAKNFAINGFNSGDLIPTKVEE